MPDETGSPAQDERPLVRRHVLRCRLLWAVFFATVPAAGFMSFHVPRLEPGGATPTTLTLLAFAACLWVTFTAERDASRRLERARRAFAVHSELRRLLRDHLLVILAVLVRLEVVVVLSLVVAVWGWGHRAALWIAVLAALMMILAWPTARKVALVIHRARQQRDRR